MQFSTLLIQIAVILVTTRLVGRLLRRIHQPQVVGEMLAGILLGPSLLGWLLPGVYAAVFPPDSLGPLNALSQIGLLVFMFLVGVEFDSRILRGRGHVAVVTSHASIIVPFVLGAALALFLHPVLSPTDVPVLHFAMFTGLAMSITAFPVLARILAERNLLRTRVGSIAIACAAVDDVTAWCLLAAVVALTRSIEQTIPFAVTLFGSLAYIGVMLFGVRRVLAAYFSRRREVTYDRLAIILVLAITSAWVTEMLGIHALFGAFLMGVVMPKDAGFNHALASKLEPITVTLLLPLFFAYTGLRMNIGFLSDAQLWLYCGLIIVVAVAGKLGGSSLVARRFGMSWREAGALGVLVNTRGLIELVFLNIGLDIGVISPTFFTMMVLMALVTTFMTTPLLGWVYPPRLYEQEIAQRIQDEQISPSAAPTTALKTQP
jgi:Kef-type K+ transport system membrane component KefB